ncbi:MAG: hypothetical protein ACJATI_001750 [Halioglobus sp.]
MIIDLNAQVFDGLNIRIYGQLGKCVFVNNKLISTDEIILNLEFPNQGYCIISISNQFKTLLNEKVLMIDIKYKIL